MLRISNVKVYDLKESIIACRNAFRLVLPEYTEEEFQKSLETAKKLVKTSTNSGEQTFLSGIRVAFDLVYPNYISPELQRYHWVDIVTSNSKMHTLLKMNLYNCCNKYVTIATIQNMTEYIDEYNQLREKNASQEELYEAFMKVISNCPQGIELFMRVSTNYLQLKNIYKQRKHHKLKEDWGAFCKFVEELPYADELILTDKACQNI